MAAPTKRPRRTIRSLSSKLTANLCGVYKACGPRVALSYVLSILVSAPRILRAGTLVPADQNMVGRTYRWTVNDISIDLEGRYWPGAREMYGRRVYFPTDDFRFRPRTVVVDLGSNVGLFSLLAAKTGCRVVAVEAQIGLTRQMQELAKRLGLDTSISVENALIGAGSGEFSDIERFLVQPDVEGIVANITLDQLMRKHRIEEVDFLKIDIEGSEFDLFSSQLDWLPKVRRIAAEVHCDYGCPEFILDVLRQHRFSVDLRDENLTSARRIVGSSGYIFARQT